MKLNIHVTRNPRTGKPVTVVSGIQHNPAVIGELASLLKARCGAGGHVKGKTILIQGSHPEKIRKILHKEGYELSS